MTDSLILHHYEQSPYAEKIRLMFGLTNSPWCSLESPPWPPRPNVDPLSGGYRRIPVAQLGADIFCDSSLIAQEVADITGNAALNPANAEGEALELMTLAEGPGFFSAVRAVPPLKLLGMMLMSFGPFGTYSFIKDRGSLTKGGSAKTPTEDDARRILAELFQRVEQRLQDNPWIGGSEATIADFCVYHPIWLHLNCKGHIPTEASATRQWFEKVGALGHGKQQNISQADAFAAAKNEPRALPTSEDTGSGPALGSPVSVAPEDYGVVPVTGTLAALTQERIIVARETDGFGTVHVHFPRSGYAIGSV